jgi:hypothetical protein
LYLVDGSGLHYEDDGLSDEQRGAVERYLRSGVVLHEDGGDRLLTDGVFAWPEELARTYPGHGLRLPDDLVRLALERGGTVPPITQAQVEELRNRGIDVSGRPTEASTPPSPYPITRFATGRGGRARTFEAIPATLSSTGDVQDGVSSPTSSASKRGVSPLLIGLSAIILGLSVGTLLLARRQEEDEEEIDEEQEEEQEEIDAIEAQMKSGR